ncbi:MAG: hypothetical protein Kow002_09600 [Anaerolineales bacterium]
MKASFSRFAILALTLLLITACASPNTLNNEAENPAIHCKKIVFSYSTKSQNGFDSNIVAMCPDGSEKHRLTSDSYDDLMPVWSPDGREIAFLSNRTGNLQVHIMDQNGENIRQIAFSTEEIARIAWLPGENKIAVLTTTGDGIWQWQAIDVATKEMQPLTNWDIPPDTTDIAFAHHNSLLAYQVFPPQTHKVSLIFVQTKDGQNTYALTPESWSHLNILPAWSPDDEHIAFVSNKDNEDDLFSLYIADANGENIRRITEQSFTQPGALAWAPDGKSIALFADGSFYILNIENGATQKLFAAEYPDTISSISWQP